MATRSTTISSQTAGDLATMSPVLSKPCPKPKTSITVYVCVNTSGRPPVVQADVDAVKRTGAVSLGVKPTDKNGQVSHSNIDVDSYTVTVTLSGDNLLKYAWGGSDDASESSTKSAAADSLTFFPFQVILLARPKIKVLWQEDDTPVGQVKVQLSPNIALTDTADEVGIASLPDATRGLRPKSYDVLFTFPSKNVELMDNRSINVTENVQDPYKFHIRKCWVEFVVTDNFTLPWEEADYVLTYPDTHQETGSLAAKDNGKVRKDVPPGEYKFELKLITQPQWSTSSAEIDKPLKVKVNASGFAASDITFEIYDACSPSGSALDTATASEIKEGVAEADWTPTAVKLDKVTSGKIVFIAKAGKQAVTSPPVEIKGKRVFNVTGPDNGPLETDLLLHFTNGVNVSARSAGGKAEPLVPLGLGLVSIELSGQAAVYPSFELAGGSGKQVCYFPPST